MKHQFFMPVSILLLFLSLQSFSQTKSETGDSNLQLSEPAALLEEYISIPTVTGNETLAKEFLLEWGRKNQLHTRILTDSSGCLNMVFSLFPLPDPRPSIILVNHIDVVPAGDPAFWTHPPFCGELQDACIIGRGAIDNKGLAVMQLMALKEFSKNPGYDSMQLNICVLCVSEEEKGGDLGSKIVTERFLGLLNPVLVLCEGGTGLPSVSFAGIHKPVFNISIAEKRSLWLKLSVLNSDGGHTSVYNRYSAQTIFIQALDRLLSAWPTPVFGTTTRQMFQSLGEASRGLKGFGLKYMHRRIFRPVLKKYMHTHPVMTSLFSNTIAVTVLSSDEEKALNQNQTEVTAVLDCRLLPGQSDESFIAQLEKTINDSKVKISILRHDPDTKASQPEKYYAFLSDAIRKEHPDAAVIPILLPATSDCFYYRAKGITSFGINPATFTEELLKTIHNPNERIPLAALDEGIRIYTSFFDLIMSKE